jgi:hypothetical protein
VIGTNAIWRSEVRITEAASSAWVSASLEPRDPILTTTGRPS